MPAVVFGPDRVIHRGRSEIGLVLGAGGVLGAAWMTGALVYCVRGQGGRMPPRLYFQRFPRLLTVTLK